MRDCSAILCVLLLAGCPKDGALTSNGTEGTSDGASDGATSAPTTGGAPAETCPDHPRVDACCCFAALPADEPRYVETQCPSMALCDAVEFDCSQIDETCTTSTEPALACALAALADGTKVGGLVVHYNIDGGYGDTRLEIDLQGDGTAYIVREDVLDLSDVHRPTGRFDLKPKSYFDGCIAAMTVDEKSDCLDDIVAGEATELCIGELYADAL